MKTISTQIILCNKCGKCAIITSNCFLTRSFVSKVNTLTQVLIENKKCHKTITCSITKIILYRSWIARSSLGLLKEVCVKVPKKFCRSWLAKPGHWSFTEKLHHWPLGGVPSENIKSFSRKFHLRANLVPVFLVL